MITRQYDLPEQALSAVPEPVWQLAGASGRSSVFFDIETTGFSPASSRLYLIGAAWRVKGGWRLTQWMSERPSEEDALLRVFDAFLRPFDTLIHFNGDRFDLPYLRDKYAALGMPDPAGRLRSIDLYRDFRPLRRLLGLDHMNQKALEAFLGIVREDRFDGGRLIEVFRRFCKDRDPEDERLLLLHNREDVAGMLRLMTLYAYRQPALAPEPAGHLTAAEDGKTSLVLRAAFPVPFPVPVQRSLPGPAGKNAAASGAPVSLALTGSRAILEIPVLQGCLRHYFADYRSYYYLPQEDEAIHKSVAAFVDRKYRVQATAGTCYTKKTGRFLPLWADESRPCFRQSREDPQGWILLPDDWQDPAFLQSCWKAAMKDLSGRTDC